MCMCSWKQEHAELYFQCRSSITTRPTFQVFSKLGFIEHTCILFSLEKDTEFLKQSIGSPMLVPCCVLQLIFDFLSLFFRSLHLSWSQCFLSTMLFCQPTHLSLFFSLSLYCFVQHSNIHTRLHDPQNRGKIDQQWRSIFFSSFAILPFRGVWPIVQTFQKWHRRSICVVQDGRFGPRVRSWLHICITNRRGFRSCRYSLLVFSYLVFGVIE